MGLECSGDSSRQWPAWAGWLIGALIVGLGVLHLAFVLDGYGEQDAALTGITAILWAQDGKLPVESGTFVEERFRSNPLYLYGLYVALKHGLTTPGGLVGLMNPFSTVSGVLLPIVVFFLLRRLLAAGGQEGTGERPAGARAMSCEQAAAATLMLLASPIFFHSRCYGFPALPALLLTAIALLAFQWGVNGRSLRWLWFVPALAFLVAAVLTKVDVILLAPAFVVTALAGGARRGRTGNLVASILLPVAALTVWHVFCNALLPGEPDTVRGYTQWSDRWPLHPAGLTYLDNLESIAMAPGMGTSLAFLAAVIIGLVRKDLRWATVGVLACIVPTLLFWGMRHAVSSRHNLWIVVPMAAWAAFWVHRSIRRPHLKVGAIIAICAVNWFVGPQEYSGKTASGRFIYSGYARCARTAQRDRAYAIALREAKDRRICFFANPEPAYPAVTALGMGRSCTLRRTGAVERVWLVTATIDGKPTAIWIPPRDDRSEWLWNKMVQEQWLALGLGPGDPPLVQFFRSGAVVPWMP